MTAGDFMTEDEIKTFFMVTEKNLNSYTEVREKFSEDQIKNEPELLVIEILKKTYGFPISFFDSGKEDNFTLSEKRSQEIYEGFAMDIIDGEYEDLYDFTQDFSASLPEE